MLDCSDPATAAASAAALLKLDTENLTSLIAKSVDLDPAEDDVNARLWERVLAAGAEVPELPFAARFFHGTRTLAAERFTDLGVLRLTDAIDGIWDDLHRLVPEVDRSAWGEFRTAIEEGGRVTDPGSADLYRAKVLDNPDFHGGVYGFLVRDVAVAPPSGHHNYCEAPEIVEDIIRCAPPDWGLGLKFTAASTPCLVHFRWRVESLAYVRTALGYVWVDNHGGSLGDLTSATNTGCHVPPGSVLGVEVLGSDGPTAA
jgi:hypothetical protein